MGRIRALWWWIDRWRKSTAYTDMTLEEQGAYRNLIDEATLRNGPIPNDERILAKACGDAQRWRKVRPAVIAHFTLTTEGWRNETLDSVIHESERRAKKQRNYRNKAGNEAGYDAGNEIGNETRPPSPSPSPVKTEEKANTAAAPPRVPKFSQHASEPAEDGNFSVVLKLAHDVMESSGLLDPADPELLAQLKDACGKAQIDYGRAVDPGVCVRALKSAARARSAGIPTGKRTGGLSDFVAELQDAPTPEAMGQRLRALSERGR